ncbi:hypothetical protein [Acidithiobacillus marinus]|uniref:hypothetical protein n=1 Tax=Acidithiobacillus marinus TaxID=187490 RepID=UPI00117A1EF4|nr:hypothetical protein [Acidithiobacillus marinus]
MLSEVLITELPSYGLGRERGMHQGMEHGEQLMLSRLLPVYSGPVAGADGRHSRRTTELEVWAGHMV